MPIFTNHSELAKTFLVARDQEQAYCEANKIIFERYPSNLKVVGIQKLSSDDIYSSVNLSFSVGHYADPVGKLGLHHFVEHILVSRGAYDFARKQLANLNATTSSDSLRVIVQAFFNPEYKHIGMYPVLDELFVHLSNNLDIEAHFNAERQVLEDEYRLMAGDFGTQVNHELNKILFTAKNPMQFDWATSISDIANISANDIRQVFVNELVQNNATISILGVGDQEQTQQIYQYLAGKLKALPTGKEMSVDLNSYDLINSNDNKDWQRVPLQIKNQLCNISFNWICDHQIDTPEAIYSGFLVDFLNGILFRKTRELGFAYDCRFAQQRISPNKRLYQAYITTSNEHLEQKVQTFTRILTELLGFQKAIIDELKQMIDQSQLQLKIMPINRVQMLNYQLDNLQYYDQLCDFEKQRDFNLSMTLEQALSTAKNFDIATATKIIIGDLA